jgi:hypothetical protein
MMSLHAHPPLVITCMLVEFQVSFWNSKFHFGIPVEVFYNIFKVLRPKFRDFSRTLEIWNVRYVVPQVAVNAPAPRRRGARAAKP